MEQVIVDKRVLDIYLKYDEDFSLLDEPWADKKDRDIISDEQFKIFGDYLEAIQMIEINNLSQELKKKALLKIHKLEKHIDVDVIKFLKDRVKS